MTDWVAMIGYILLGATWAALHLFLVARTVAALQDQSRRRLAALLTLARWLLALAVLWTVASAGAPPLLFTAAGFMAARLVLLRRALDRIPGDQS